MKRIAITAGIALALAAPVGAQTYPQTTTVTQTITPTTIVTLKVTPTTNLLTVEPNTMASRGNRQARHARIARGDFRPPVIGTGAIVPTAGPARSHETILVTRD